MKPLLTNESSNDIQRIKAIMQTINLYDENLVRYGSKVQTKFAKLANDILQSITVLNPKEIDDLVLEISSLINNAANSNKGFFGMLKSTVQKCNKATKVLDERGHELDGKRMKVLVNLETLNSLQRQNLEYYEDLECYILAGKRKLEEVRQGELRQLKQRVEETNFQGDINACNHLCVRIETFEERIQSLEKTKTMSAQMRVQINLMQSSNEQLQRKIDDGRDLIAAWRQNAAIRTGT